MKPYDLLTPDEEQQYRRQVGTFRKTIILWLVAIGLAILLFPVYLVFNQIENDTVQVEIELRSVGDRILAANTPAPAAQALMNKLAQVEQLTAALQSAAPPTGVNWPAVIAAIDNYDRAELALISLSQAGDQITLTGRAVDNLIVGRYTENLASSAVFSSVNLQSLRLVPPSVQSLPDLPTGLTAEQDVKAPGLVALSIDPGQDTLTGYPLGAPDILNQPSFEFVLQLALNASGP